MSRQDVLNAAAVPLDDRRRRIEQGVVPDNIGALLDAAAAEVPDRQALNFFGGGETATSAQLQSRDLRRDNDPGHMSQEESLGELGAPDR